MKNLPKGGELLRPSFGFRRTPGLLKWQIEREKLNPMITSTEDIQTADRPTLIAYLEGWGFQCYDHETDDELREAARENFVTEAKEQQRP